MKKYKIGYTTGVFDLFHIGHLNILEKAKEQCEYLIVGVSTDELTEKYKGVKPFIPFEERKRIVESIKYVDKVVPQITQNKIEAYNKYHFDVLMHGDDWKDTPLFKETERYLKEHGASVIYFPYTKSTSSTKIKQVINNFIENEIDVNE